YPIHSFWIQVSGIENDGLYNNDIKFVHHHYPFEKKIEAAIKIKIHSKLHEQI
ncbi:hypothetical protein ACJX0J_010754, partial [Zea mays]